MEPEPITTLLEAVRAGEPGAADHLAEKVYRELRHVAEVLMRRERPEDTLQPTALVHEGWLRLMRGEGQQDLKNRAYFFAAAGQAMRRILVERARARAALVHGGGRERVPVGEDLVSFDGQDVGILDLHQALEELAQLHPRQAQGVQLHYFSGLMLPEVAEVLGVSVSTVEGDLRTARAWLRTRLRS